MNLRFGEEAGRENLPVKRIALMLVMVYGFAGWPIRAQDREMRATAGTFAETLAKLGKKSVAVVDFTDLQGNVTELGRYLAEQMSIALALTDKGIEVVDRTHLKAIVQENKLSASGLIDPSTALKAGAACRSSSPGHRYPYALRRQCPTGYKGAGRHDCANRCSIHDRRSQDQGDRGSSQSRYFQPQRRKHRWRPNEHGFFSRCAWPSLLQNMDDQLLCREFCRFTGTR